MSVLEGAVGALFALPLRIEATSDVFLRLDNAIGVFGHGRISPRSARTLGAAPSRAFTTTLSLASALFLSKVSGRGGHRGGAAIVLIFALVPFATLVALKLIAQTFVLAFIVYRGAADHRASRAGDRGGV